MVICVLKEEQDYMRAEWRCATTTSGGQSVMTTGVQLMLKLCADNWNFLLMVSSFTATLIAGI